MNLPVTDAASFARRRARFFELFKGPALLSAGREQSRSYRDNHYPFRPSSHYWYLVGAPIPGAALLLCDGQGTLFTQPPDPEDALWHGPQPALDELRERHGLDAVRPLSELDEALKGLGEVATLPTSDAKSTRWLAERLGRDSLIENTADKLSGVDAGLADALIALRLRHDEAAIAQLRAAATISAEAHVAAMKAGRVGGTEREVHAALIGVLRRHGLEDSFPPIVSVRGEVLHNTDHSGTINDGDLVLVDAGGEMPEGWAGDITRTWPASGKLSPTQRAIYEVVLAAQLAAIETCTAGTRYRLVHEAAKRATVSGLRDLGIFSGEVDGLLERGAAAIFFPHGVGHLLGLDVHDMEDLGDRAGYAPGRTRSERFGDAYLRLDRDLEPGMAVTIEPGFYQVPGILGNEELTGLLGSDLCRAELAKYADVRGIRIEDDVLITAAGPEVLTSGVPKEPDAIEALLASGHS